MQIKREPSSTELAHLVLIKRKSSACYGFFNQSIFVSFLENFKQHENPLYTLWYNFTQTTLHIIYLHKSVAANCAHINQLTWTAHDIITTVTTATQTYTTYIQDVRDGAVNVHLI